MRVLVTGVAGFIGFHVARALAARGDEVLGLDSFDPYYQVQLKHDRVKALVAEAGLRVCVVPCDFADPVALADATAGVAFDRIVHLGAQAGVRHSIDNPLAYGRSNLVGHLNIIELARRRQVTHLVYASSSSVYGNRDSVPLSTDLRVDQPISLYAATKRADELMSETYAHLYRLPQTGLRFFTVYGPWGRPDMAMWLFTSAILKGQPIQLFNNGGLWRDFTYVDDIVAGIVAALDHPPADDGSLKPGGSTGPHRIYNVGNSRPEKVCYLIDVIERTCGMRAVCHRQPMQPGDVTATFADIDDIVRDLGYRPLVSIDTGVPRFVSWFRAYTGL